MSRNCAEVHIIGNFVRAAKLDSVTKVTIASNLQKKQGDEYVDDPHFNTVNVWAKHTQDFVEKELKVGDLIRITGRLRESSYDDTKTGEKIYTVDLHAATLDRLAKKQEA